MELNLNTTDFLKLSSKVEELNKRLTKLGIKLIKLTYTEKVITVGESVKFSYICHLDIPSLKLNDWELVSHIEFIENVPFSKTRKDVEIPLKYLENKELSRSCEHCNTNRKRNNTYVVLNKNTNEFKIVGSECLKDFTGHKSPDSYLKVYNKIFSFMDEPYSMGGGKYTIALSPIELLSWASMVTREMNGFYSNKKAEEQGIPSTSNMVDMIFNSSNDSIVTFKKYLKSFKNTEIIETGYGNTRKTTCNNVPEWNITEKDVQLAKDTLNFIENMNSRTEYVHNLKQLLELEFIPEKKFSYFISALGVYLNKLEEEKNNKINPSEYISKIGDKLSEYVQVINTVHFTNKMGYEYTTITMINTKGNIIVWFASGSYNFSREDFFLISGRIIDHKEYKNVKQTLIKNCRIKQVDNSERIFKIKTIENE